MRIISGEFGGRSLIPPADRQTRPMLDRVREALFSTVGNLVEEARVLDLFAGTGSLGLEALSRGADFVRFVETGRGPRALLQQNVDAFRVAERSQVLGTDALRSTSWSRPAPPAGGAQEGAQGVAKGDASSAWLDLIFMDPPYPLWKEAESRRSLLATVEQLVASYLRPNGALMLHTAPRDLDAPELPEGAESRRYGRSVLWYIWR